MAGVAEFSSHLTEERRVISSERSLAPVRSLLERETLPITLYSSRDELMAFYASRQFSLRWFDTQSLHVVAGQVMKAIWSARQDGLEPEDYHFSQIESYLDGILSDRRQAELDVIISDALLLLARHLANGRVGSQSMKVESILEKESVSLETLSTRAEDAASLSALIDSYRPQHAAYQQLRDLMGVYQGIEARGGWLAIPPGDVMQLNTVDYRVALLRWRLRAGGDLANDLVTTDRNRFDEPVKQAVMRFQRRHRLKADGVVGNGTLRHLNRPVDTVIQQMALNLERWRWLPRQLGDRHIRVNIAAYRLNLVQDGASILDMRVVVGKRDRQTPMLTKAMTSIVLNPTWTIPPTIAKKDILPKLRENTNYLNQRNMRMYAGWSRESPEVFPDELDLSQYNESYFPFRIQQAAGRGNALGKVKFLMPNHSNIYLHDTNSRGLFRKPQRAYSSGCVRLEKPMALAEKLLGQDSGWRMKRIKQVIASGSTHAVRLKKPLPVHLTYETVTVIDGQLHYLRDIYRYDKPLAKAFLHS